jgi:uncharacterized protein YjiS (DUF1127 family)
MQEGQLLMTQADRDRLVTLRKAKKRLITQKQAAEELGFRLEFSPGFQNPHPFRDQADAKTLRPQVGRPDERGPSRRRPQCTPLRCASAMPARTFRPIMLLSAFARTVRTSRTSQAIQRLDENHLESVIHGGAH